MSESESNKPKQTIRPFEGDVPAAMPTYRLTRLKRPKGKVPAFIDAGGLRMELKGADVCTGVPQVLVDALPPDCFRITREKGKK